MVGMRELWWMFSVFWLILLAAFLFYGRGRIGASGERLRKVPHDVLLQSLASRDRSPGENEERKVLLDRDRGWSHSVFLQRPDEVRIDEQPVVPAQGLDTRLLGGGRCIEGLPSGQQQRLQIGLAEGVGALRQACTVSGCGEPL